MAKEQTFKSPGFFEREIDLSQATAEQFGIPYGLIGTSQKGPAFVPVTVGSFEDFKVKFGPIEDDKQFAAHAVKHIFQANENLPITFVRTLGAGANETSDHINTTETTGQVNSAGFVVTGTNLDITTAPAQGCVQFLVGEHTLPANEAFGFPMFTDNDSRSVASRVKLVRGVVLMASGARLQVAAGTGSLTYSQTMKDITEPTTGGEFRLILSSSNGADFNTHTDGTAGIKVLSASYDPASANYIGKILNTDPKQFATEQHLLYADYAVDVELATLTTAVNSVGVLSGSSAVSTDSGDTSMEMIDAFGHFDTRYRTPRTTWFISQPYGTTEHDLFYFETRDDGAYANTKYKVSIANIRRSLDTKDPYATFEVQVRLFDDNDRATRIVESFPNCTLNPKSPDYVARKIGDTKLWFNFDATDEVERRLVRSGRYGNQSSYIRIVMHANVADGTIPKDAVPFGFRGLPVLKTSDNLVDGAITTAPPNRLHASAGALTPDTLLTGSLVPPVPFTFKATKGQTASSGFAGLPGNKEVVDRRVYWGVKTTSVPASDVLNANNSTLVNNHVASLTKLIGLPGLDMVVTGSGADTLNNNKFSLARVALSVLTTPENITGSVNEHMREAAYIRNADYFNNTHLVTDGVKANRVSFATLLSYASGSVFNSFSPFMKFTNIFYGGFDGLNILDSDAARMNDKAASNEEGASTSFTSPGLANNQNGTGVTNSTVWAYRRAADVLTDPMVSNCNVISIPGIREPLVIDHLLDRVKDDYKRAFAVVDFPHYDGDQTRLYDDSTTRPDVYWTRITNDGRGIDNNYAGVYFPDVVVKDNAQGTKRIDVPASVAALRALAYNDKVAYPWFAPAGFNRGALDNVTNVKVRLKTRDRDDLQDSRINPIATFPREGFVIFGQKTLQQAKSALDRVNVRRMLLEVKRIISDIALGLTFEANVESTWKEFRKAANTQLALVKRQQGIEGFKVTMDASNNTQTDIENYIMRGRIEVIPTRAIEFVAIDFIITNAGVEFV